MCFWYWFPFLMLLFHAFNHCNFIFLQICFLTKLMMIAFMLLIIDNSWAALLINWSAFSFSIMLLRLDIHCMWIWHCFWRKLIRFCRMSLNNFALMLLFVFSLCKVIWLFMYIQISLFLSAFSLHIAIASLIACSFAFVVIFFSSLSACSLWLWHCLDAVHMLGYMYLDQSRCFISFHWSITSIVCANKHFQPNNFSLSCSRFLAPSCSSHSTFSFSVIIFLSQFEYFSSTLALQFFQSWW